MATQPKTSERPIGLDPDQDVVADLKEGTHLVLAGAGSGKTSTMTHRVARLIESGVSPGTIMVLTFTNRAATEMISRIKKLIDKDAGGLWAGTFHSIAARLLRRVAVSLGYPTSKFSILTEDDALVIMRAILRKESLKHFDVGPGDVKSILSYCTNTLQDPRDFLSQGTELVKDELLEEFINFVSDAQKRYTAAKRRQNAMDFDDLLVNWEKALRTIPAFKQMMHEEFQFLMVDESQDTNPLQWKILHQMVEHNQNLMAIGDSDQSIYAFRGASIKEFLALPEIYPGLERWDLERNYRSTDAIVQLANVSIANNKGRFDRKSVAVAPEGEKPTVARFSDSMAEARGIADFIAKLPREELKETAVLFRSAYLSIRLQFELAKRQVPFTLRGGLSFFAKGHVRDALSWFRLSHNPHDKTAWMRAATLFPGLGPATFEKVWLQIEDDPMGKLMDAKKTGKGWPEFMDTYVAFRDALLRDTAEAFEVVTGPWFKAKLYKDHKDDAESRIQELTQLAEILSEYTDLETMMEELALMTGDERGKKRDGLVLSTVHAAKGLEWNRVFVIGLNDGHFPTSKAVTTDQLEEERRTFYVAITRAARLLCMSCSEMVLNWSQELVPARPSPFLLELPKGMVLWESVGSY